MILLAAVMLSLSVTSGGRMLDNRMVQRRAGMSGMVGGEIDSTTFDVDFDAASGMSGVTQLLGDLCVNGRCVSPSCSYAGSGCDATGCDALAGDALTAAGSGGTYGVGTPTRGSAMDAAVDLAGARYYEGGASTCDVTTGDVVIVALFRAGATGTMVFSKRTSGAGGTGYELSNVSGSLRLSVQDSDDDTTTFTGPSISAGVWYLAVIAINRDWASGSGVYTSLNGSAVTSAGGNATTYAQSWTSSQVFTLGADIGGASIYDEHLAYLAIYESASWLAASTAGIDALSRDLFYRLSGVWPAVARGTARPVFTRTTNASLINSGQLYHVGPGWPRVSDADAGTGYLPEDDATNLMLQTEDASTSHTATRVSIVANTTTAPDGESSGDTIHEDATATTSHISYQSALPVTLGETYVYSRYVQAANRSWVVMQCQSSPMARAYFNVSTGALGDGTNEIGLASKHIEAVGSWYRVSIVFTATATTNVLCGNWVVAADGGDINTVSGLDQDSYYVWGEQFEAGYYPTSYVKTTTVAVARDDDGLIGVGLANLGGVGSNKSGTLTVEFTCPDYDLVGYPELVTLTDGASINDRLFAYVDQTSDAVAWRIDAATVTTYSATGATDVFDGTRHRASLAYQIDDVAQYLDGALEGSDVTVADITDDLDEIRMGASYGGTTQPGCLIHRVTHWRWPTP